MHYPPNVRDVGSVLDHMENHFGLSKSPGRFRRKLNGDSAS
jgi:hypothetical protein